MQALGLKRDDTFSVTMLGHCIEMYIGDTHAYIGRSKAALYVVSEEVFFLWACPGNWIVVLSQSQNQVRSFVAVKYRLALTILA